ncbi:MAG TPA: efflux RND transporter periplasmic adaptor subunit, partial [Gemmatimonadota bacterium]
LRGVRAGAAARSASSAAGRAGDAAAVDAGGGALEAEGTAADAAGAEPEAGAAAAGPESGYRTHLYSERDADVHALLEDTENAPGAAFVKQLHADLGDRVRAGQLLLTLENERLELQVRAATARAEETRARVERMRKLLDQGYAAAAEFETLEHQREEAEAELEQAQLDLSRTRVLAPFAGVVARRYVRVGERIESGTPLFRVTAMSPLRARVLVPERESDVFRRGAPVIATGLDGVQAGGRVVRVGPTVDPASGTREVVVELARTGDLVPGAEVVVRPAAEPAEES